MMARSRSRHRFLTCAILAVAGLAMTASDSPAAAPRAAHQENPGTARVRRIAPTDLLVRHAVIWTQSGKGVLQDADLLIRQGKITAVGHDLKAPEGATIINARGKHVTPGLIDCHSHTAIRGGVNEGSNNITAEVRILDAL
ncbi:MAG: hypothetical protein ACE5ID_07520, partial [Acidobacteriota bacterium]